MWIADKWRDYELLDCGGGEKLERWDRQLLVRPDPQAIWETPRRNPAWKRADGSLVQVFYCGTYKRQGKNYCSSHAVSCETVFGEILRELKSLFEETKEWREQLFKDEKDGEWLLKRRERTERALLRARARKRACYEDYRDGLIGRDEFKAYHEDYRRQEELLSESLEALRAGGEALFSDSSPALRLNRLSAAILVEQVLVYGDGRILVRYRNEKSC